LPNAKPYNSDMTQSDLRFFIDRTRERLNSHYDIVLACYWLSGIVSLELRSLLRAKIVCSFCSLGYYKLATSPSHRLVRRFSIEKGIASRVDHIIACSATESDTLIRDYGVSPHKISIIPRGVDPDVFKPST